MAMIDAWLPTQLGWLLRASHPEPAAAVTAVAALLALAVGRGPVGALAVGVTLAASQLCVGWTNDWLDADRDTAVGRPDKPIAQGRVSRRAVGLAAAVAGLLVVPLAALSGPWAALVATVGLVSGLAYDWPLKFTVLSPLPYLVSFGTLPAFVVLGKPATPPWWMIIAAALLGGGAHFVNVLPDLADDARTGVRGLPQRLGATGSWLAGGTLLLSATGILVFAPRGAPSRTGLVILAAAAVALPVGWARSRRPGSRAPFRAVLLVALADVILLLISGTGA
jgi:4-hydroxybenzoate polyprenyltransferase